MADTAPEEREHDDVLHSMDGRENLESRAACAKTVQITAGEADSQTAEDGDVGRQPKGGRERG